MRCCAIIIILLFIQHFSLQSQEFDPISGHLQFGIPLGQLQTLHIAITITQKVVKWNQVMPKYFLAQHNQYSTELTFTAASLLNNVQTTAKGTTTDFSYTNGADAVESKFVTRIRCELAYPPYYFTMTSGRILPYYIRSLPMGYG